jgi:hypothetical protein
MHQLLCLVSSVRTGVGLEQVETVHIPASVEVDPRQHKSILLLFFRVWAVLLGELQQSPQFLFSVEVEVQLVVEGVSHMELKEQEVSGSCRAVLAGNGLQFPIAVDIRVVLTS